MYAWVESPGNAAMWLASACDRVFLLRTGEVALVGLGAELTFLGGVLDRLGVEADIVAAGAYKSFGEQFTRTFASAENREATGLVLDDLQAALLDDVAAGRGISREAVRAAMDAAPLGPQDALAAGLVDALMYADELDAWVTEAHGEEASRVPFERWAAVDAVIEGIEGWGQESEGVAVLHLSGSIVMDDSGFGTMIRARKVVPVLKALREDPSVRAVVLHVDSPGGSALASDLIWREVELIKRTKPVVASFEDVAASGGYYLAAPATEILARPGTLTGSIGVVGGKLVAREGLRRLGVHAQTVGEAPNAHVFSPMAPFTDEQRTRFKASLDRFYDGFVSRVAAGRRRPVDAIEPHCRGRVWTGRSAIERGLVDRIGSLDDAVGRAASYAGLRAGAYRRVDLTVEPRRSFVSKLVQGVLRGAVASPSAKAIASLLGASALVDVLARHPAEPLAMLPLDLRVR